MSQINKLNKKFEDYQILEAEEMNSITQKIDEVIEQVNTTESGLEVCKASVNTVSDALCIKKKSSVTNIYQRGKYRNIAGAIIGGSTYIISEKFQVKKGDLIRVLVKGTENVAYLSEVTSEQSFIRVLLGGVACSNFTEFRMIADRDMYLEACSNTISESGYIFEVYSWALGSEFAQPGGPCRQLYENAGAVYNEGTGFYELNGLTDITEEQMAEIYNYTLNMFMYTWKRSMFQGGKFRTNLVNRDYNLAAGEGRTIDFSNAFAFNDKLEVFNYTSYPGNNMYIRITKISYAFYGCKKLTEISQPFFINQGALTTEAFTNCVSLEKCFIRSLMASLSFKDSPKLSKESISYIVSNSAATSPITITLHADAYAMAMEDEEIQAALKEKTNVSLATA